MKKITKSNKNNFLKVILPLLLVIIFNFNPIQDKTARIRAVFGLCLGEYAAYLDLNVNVNLNMNANKKYEILLESKTTSNISLKSVH